MNKICLVCGNQFIKKVNCSLKSWDKYKYCSRHCYYVSKKGKEALNKGRVMSEAYRKKVSDNTKKQWKEGRGVGNFIKGMIPWNKKYYDIPKIKIAIYQNIEWRRKIFERDNYTCQECGKRGDLNAHHIIPVYQIIQDERWL